MARSKPRRRTSDRKARPAARPPRAPAPVVCEGLAFAVVDLDAAASLRTAVARVRHVAESGLETALAEVGSELAVHASADPAVRDALRGEPARGGARSGEGSASARPGGGAVERPPLQRGIRPPAAHDARRPMSER